MSDLTHLALKLVTERARQTSTQRTPSNTDPAPPPPYNEAISDDSSDDGVSDSDSENDNDEIPPKDLPAQNPLTQPKQSSTPLKLTINAAHSIQGSNNLVPTSTTSPLADAARFSQLLFISLNQITAAAAIASQQPGQQQQGWNGNIDLTINCGITVVGDRNVVGNVGLRPKGLLPTAVGSPGSGDGVVAVVGGKRKAEEEEGDEGAVKKVAREEAEVVT